MYPAILILHSTVRWAVVALLAFCAVRCALGLLARRAWNTTDERTLVALIAAIDTQLLLGLGLWLFVSPYAIGRNAGVPFFTFVHPVAMILAVLVVHVGRVRALRRDAQHRHGVLLASLLLAGLVVACAVPWPWTVWARPLLRLGGA